MRTRSGGADWEPDYASFTLCFKDTDHSGTANWNVAEIKVLIKMPGKSSAGKASLTIGNMYPIAAIYSDRDYSMYDLKGHKTAQCYGERTDRISPRRIPYRAMDYIIKTKETKSIDPSYSILTANLTKKILRYKRVVNVLL